MQPTTALARRDPSPFVLTPDRLARLASDRIVARGIAYARAGRVQDLAEQGSRLEARVIGTRREPYLVTIEHDGEELLAACTCPFEWEPFCKHAIAALAARAGHVEGRRGALDEVRALELHVRSQRGKTGGFRFRCIEGDGVIGAFEVRSPTGQRYEVWIRSFAERLNRCTCHDHATSMLGTCKHIEAVIQGIERRARRRVERERAGVVAAPMVVVSREDTPRPVLRLPAGAGKDLKTLAGRWFDRTGAFRGDLVEDMALFLDEARSVRSLTVFPDVVELSRETAAHRAADRRVHGVRAWFAERQGTVPGIRARLYPYQIEGAAFLASAARALLADDMGLGKTVQAIVATRALIERGEAERALVVCPASLKHQWAAEIARFTGLEPAVVEGGRAARRETYAKGATFTIANYEIVLRDLDFVGSLDPQILVVDEAQRIKNWRTVTATRVKSIRTPFVFVLTGTPLENRLDDLYSIMQLVSPMVLGPLWAFNEQFMEREPGKIRPTSYKNLGELRRRLRPVMLRRQKEEVLLQLPERIDSRFTVELTGDQRKIMDEAVQTAAMIAARGRKRPLTPAELDKLARCLMQARMACNAASLVDRGAPMGSPKLDELARIIEDVCIDGGKKAVVFGQWELFQRMVAKIADRLGVGYVRLHGGVPSARRGALIEKFRDDPGCKLFLSTDAGGVGLNLQFASTVVNLEYPWNPAVLDQRIGRVHRLGQKEPVHVILLVAENSIETRIEHLLGAKRDLFRAAVLADSTVDEVSAPGTCLSLAQALFCDEQAVEVAVAEADRGEPVEETPLAREAPLAEEPAPATWGEPTDTRPIVEVEAPPRALPAAAAAPGGNGQDTPDPIRLPSILGHRVERVVRLRTGEVVAVVDSIDEVTSSAAQACGAIPLARAAVEGLSILGEASPFARAEVLAEGMPAGGDPRARLRQAHTVAERKLRAAETMLQAGLPAEAIAAARDAMIATARGIAGDAAGTDLPVARLLFEVLVPPGRLTLEMAALVAKADGLARAWSDSPVPPGADLASAILDDARLVVRASDA